MELSVSERGGGRVHGGRAWVTEYPSAEASHEEEDHERNRRDSEVIDLVRCLARILIFP